MEAATARRVITAIAWFVAPLATAGLLLQSGVEWRLGAARDGEIGKINGILAGELAPELSLWGASTVHIQLDPEIIGASAGMSAYNFGLTGNAFWQYRGLLEEYLRERDDARVAAIGLNVLEFEKREAIYLVHQWLHHLDVAPVYAALHSTDKALWKARYVPFYRLTMYDRHVLNRLRADAGKMLGRADTGGDAESRRRGFVPDDSPWQLGDAVSYDDHRIVVDREVTDELIRIARIGIARGIRVEVVLLPCFASYRDSIDNLADLRLELEYLRQHGVDTIDLLSDTICDDRDNWRDRHHLNASGAARLSATVGDRLAERLQARLE